MDRQEDDEALPDADYRSIYGLPALHARDLRRLRATARRLEALEHQVHATMTRLTALAGPPAPHPTARQALLALVAQLSDADAEALWQLLCSWYPPKPSP